MSDILLVLIALFVAGCAMWIALEARDSTVRLRERISMLEERLNRARIVKE